MENFYSKQEIDGMRTQTLDMIHNLTLKIDSLATKEDIAEIAKFLKNVDIGVSFIRISGRLMAQIGSFLAAIGAIYVAVKYFFGSLIVHLFK